MRPLLRQCSARATAAANAPSPFKIAHTALDRSTLPEYPGPRPPPPTRGLFVPQGDSMQEVHQLGEALLKKKVWSMLGSAFRDRNNAPIAESPRPSHKCAARIGWAILFLDAIRLYFSHLGAIACSDRDEPLAWISATRT